MAERRIEPVGCLGRVLTLLGIVWLGIVVLGGIGVLSDIGPSEGFFAGAFGSAIPGILLLWAGRALRRRAKAMETGPVTVAPAPAPTEKRVPTIRVEPSSPPPPPTQVIRAPEKPVEPPEDPGEAPLDLPPPLKPPPPKTSQELVDEARKRWGKRPPPA